MKEVAPQTYLIDSLYVREGVGAIYLLLEPKTKKFLLVDCGTAHSVALVEKAAQKLGTSLQNLEAIFLTHVHLDHGAGAGAFMQKAKDAKLYVHPKGARHIIDPSRLLETAEDFYKDPVQKLFGDVVGCPEDRVLEAQNDQILDFYGRKLQVHFSPGHAKHHMSLWDIENKLYFAGDTAGIVYPNWSGEKFFALLPTSPTDFDPDLWRKTAKEIREKAPKKIFITHFGGVENVKNLLFQVENCLQKLIFIALENRKEARGEARTKAINNSIAKMMQEELSAIDPSFQKNKIDSWFQKDYHIAASGLDHWLTKQE
jgi:glyoxylase-like metal-dependent hydrolase (beta-lactamase superfamily II)